MTKHACIHALKKVLYLHKKGESLFREMPIAYISLLCAYCDGTVHTPTYPPVGVSSELSGRAEKEIWQYMALVGDKMGHKLDSFGELEGMAVGGGLVGG